ncbi:hypothetical protein SAMN02745127_03157 [Oceanospirillum multiglobuliferum]|uniref:Phosphatidic acid phosphatase type 2/haloperoxidase domain-containing protein n=1 Tax=Oceanospirillum multiglobuliferum TaxID=64969 RepID=A0A1T4SLH9_9GAMM|nr:hypothetical protein [Oceanospirillum multiglobuliferum]OPX54201.1 hypothetical protein BTE48_15515 [Oceanospirillum multiglobuliferum]SKA29047.1 hypothetical protein SAMN02745127_03157 [Oceanospirillum multiglobuliferum]
MLALIADLYTPLLLVMALWVSYQGAQLKQTLKFLFYSTLLMFVCSAIDLLLNIWPSFGLDFSTHTAITLPFFFVFSRRPSGAVALVAIPLLLSYYLLMIKLNYHSAMDILTTSLAMVPVIYAVAQRLLKKA